MLLLPKATVALRIQDTETSAFVELVCVEGSLHMVWHRTGTKESPEKSQT